MSKPYLRIWYFDDSRIMNRTACWSRCWKVVGHRSIYLTGWHVLAGSICTFFGLSGGRIEGFWIPCHGSFQPSGPKISGSQWTSRTRCRQCPCSSHFLFGGSQQCWCFWSHGSGRNPWCLRWLPYSSTHQGRLLDCFSWISASYCHWITWFLPLLQKNSFPVNDELNM